MENAPFDKQAYINSTQTFPNITFDEFQSITDLELRKDIISKNKILQTDTYNRTMSHMRWEKWKEIETFTLTFRKSPNNSYNVIHGVRNTLQKLFSQPITQVELDFAKESFKHQEQNNWVWYFEEEMRQDIIDIHNGHIPLSISSVLDGTVLKPQEPAMTVSGPWEIAAHFEPSLIPIFYQSVVATDAAYLDDIMRDWRIIEVGKRAAFNERMHVDAVEALYVWWWLIHTSNDAAVTIYPQMTSVWTIWHRYLSSYQSENEAFRNAIEKANKASLLVDMADSYSGIRKSIELKKEYRDDPVKMISMRLDSGDLIDQAIYALTLQKEAGLMDPKKDKIIIEWIEDIHEFRSIDTAIEAAWFDPKKRIIYGSWEVLVARNKLRSAVSTWYKLTNTTRWATGKISNSPWKEPIPWIPNVEIRDNERVIVQEDEEITGERLLKKVYENWEFLYEQRNDSVALDDAKERVIKTMEHIKLPTIKSSKTQEIHSQVRELLLCNIESEEVKKIA